MITALEEAMAQGSVTLLFPLLRNWSPEKLAQLRKEVDEYHATASAKVQDAWEKIAFQPEYFLSAKASRLVDDRRDLALRDLTICCSEILSVVEFYEQQHALAASGQ